MKETTCITIDVGLKQKAKIMKIDISNLVNDVLRSVVATTKEDEDIIEVQKRLNELDKKQLDIQTEKNQLLAKKYAYEQKKEKSKQKNFKDLLKKAEFIKNSGVGE